MLASELLDIELTFLRKILLTLSLFLHFCHLSRTYPLLQHFLIGLLVFLSLVGEFVEDIEDKPLVNIRVGVEFWWFSFILEFCKKVLFILRIWENNLSICWYNSILTNKEKKENENMTRPKFITMHFHNLIMPHIPHCYIW